jgi:hypothetical protein
MKITQLGNREAIKGLRQPAQMNIHPVHCDVTGFHERGVDSHSKRASHSYRRTALQELSPIHGLSAVSALE